MDLALLSPHEVDLGLADEVVTVTAAAHAGVDVRTDSGPSWMLGVQHSSQEPCAGVWIARVDGSVAGWATLELPQHEYIDVALVRGAVHPDHQGRGIGRALLDAVGTATDRPKLRLRAWHGSVGERVLEHLGGRRSQTHVVRRLDLATPNPSWPALRAEAELAAGDYELIRRVGPTPADDLAEMVVLREAINDAPDAVEFEAYPQERIVAYEQDLNARRETQYAVIVRHRASGEPAGLSLVDVDEFAPSVAHQEDTSVVPAHRGHRLGALLKLEMIDWLRTERPEVIATDTWNAHDNHHMIAVNERLGLHEVARTSAWMMTR